MPSMKNGVELGVCYNYGSYLKVRDLLSLYEVFTIITVVTG